MRRSSSRPLALVQPELAGPQTAGGAGYLGAIEDAGFELVHLAWTGRPDDRASLTDFDARLDPERPAAIFVSIGAARFIRRSCPNLARHLSFRPESLRHHAWSTLVPLDIQLNRSFVLLPFGHLEAHRGALQALFCSETGCSCGPTAPARPSPGNASTPGTWPISRPNCARSTPFGRRSWSWSIGTGSSIRSNTGPGSPGGRSSPAPAMHSVRAGARRE